MQQPRRSDGQAVGPDSGTLHDALVKAAAVQSKPCVACNRISTSDVEMARIRPKIARATTEDCAAQRSSAVCAPRSAGLVCLHG